VRGLLRPGVGPHSRRGPTRRFNREGFPIADGKTTSASKSQSTSTAGNVTLGVPSLRDLVLLKCNRTVPSQLWPFRLFRACSPPAEASQGGPECWREKLFDFLSQICDHPGQNGSKCRRDWVTGETAKR